MTGGGVSQQLVSRRWLPRLSRSRVTASSRQRLHSPALARHADLCGRDAAWAAPPVPSMQGLAPPPDGLAPHRTPRAPGRASHSRAQRGLRGVSSESCAPMPRSAMRARLAL